MADRLSGARILARPWFLATFVIAATFTPAGCLRQAGSSKPGKWIAFESWEGNFKILFPEKPTYQTTSDGKEHRYTAEYQGGRRILRVAYEPDYDTTISIARRFELVEKLPNVRGPVTPVALSIGPHPGMEATYEMQEGRSTLAVKHRVYHVGRTSYQVIAVMVKGEEARDDVERFFSSFELLSP